ncbi:hypothetical protein ACFL5M_05700 [Candidatus Neomarinimicrobiota bacterium]
MRYVVGLLLVVMLGVQCQPEEESRVDYFPLNVGDEYCYTRFGSTSKCWSKKVWFSTVRQGKTYYALSEDSLRIPWFYRKESGTGDVFILDVEELGEWRRYRFDTAVGDTFHTRLGYGDGPEDIATVVSRNDTVETGAGVFTDCITIVTVYAWEHELWEWFAPEVGLVQLEADYSFRLARARIKGVDYPPGP